MREDVIGEIMNGTFPGCSMAFSASLFGALKTPDKGIYLASLIPLARHSLIVNGTHPLHSANRVEPFTRLPRLFDVAHHTPI